MGCFRLYLFYMVNTKICILFFMYLTCFSNSSSLYSSFYFAMVLISTFITTPLYCYYLRIHDCMMSILGLLVVIASSLVMVCDSKNKSLTKIKHFELNFPLKNLSRHLQLKVGWYIMQQHLLYLQAYIQLHYGLYLQKW